MKQILYLILLLTVTISAQEDSVKVYKSGWYLGAGGSYPRYMTISDESIASHNTHGFYLRLGYNVTEHFGFRLTPNYVRLHSFYYGPQDEEVDNFTRMSAINLEAVYNILPCEKISPFVVLGYGITYFKSHNPYKKDVRPWMKDAFVGYQAVFGVGAEFKFWDDISVKAEFDYLTASNNKIDGNDHVNNVKGILQSNGDSYMNLSLGGMWYFSRGERSKICEPYGVREVLREIPIETVVVETDTIYIDKIIEKAVTRRESFVLENVRFKFDQDVLTNESEIILQNVARVLNKYPEEKIEILGHTDSWGSDGYNMDLSERRAITVKNYLTAQGVDPIRLFTAGCGERNPIADNNSAQGRAINRRIEFSIYDGISSKCPKIEDTQELDEEMEEVPINDKILQNEFENDEEKRIAQTLLKGEQLSFTNVRFKFDSDELTQPSKEILDNVVTVLKKLSDLNLEIQGHTDSDGDEVYNQFLSEKRAISVQKYLVENGINENKLTNIGFGENKPVTENTTSEGKAKNRRIEFKVIK